MGGTVRVCGVDPGFLNTGMSVVERDASGAFSVCALRMVRSQKATRKEAVDQRVSVDDARRLKLIHGELDALVDAWGPAAVAVEAYAPFGGRMGGNAWKCAMTYGLVQAHALGRRLALFCFLPSDLKRAFGGKATATKDDVARALSGRLANLAEHLEAVPTGQREHVTDATGHALLAFEHMDRLLTYAGIGR